MGANSISTTSGITIAATDTEDGYSGRIEFRCLGIPLLMNEVRDLCMISSKRHSPSHLCHTVATGFVTSEQLGWSGLPKGLTH